MSDNIVADGPAFSSLIPIKDAENQSPGTSSSRSKHPQQGAKDLKMQIRLLLLCTVLTFVPHCSVSSPTGKKGGKAVLRSALAEMMCTQRALEHNFTTEPRPHKSQLYKIPSNQCRYIRWTDCGTPKCRKFNYEERKNCRRNENVFIDDIIRRENKSTSRAGLQNQKFRWPALFPGQRNIPYEIVGNWAGDYVYMIERAMRAIEYCTCIKFIKRTTEPDYIAIGDAGKTCGSEVGKIGGKQGLNLFSEQECYQGVIIHELLHAIGFNHEHIRPDRDQWVKVNLDKVPDDKRYNWERMKTSEWNGFNIKYDYNSILHYGSRAGSTDGSVVMSPVRQPDAVLGQTEFLSLYDAIQVMLMYKCYRIPLHANCPIYGIGRRGDWYNTEFRSVNETQGTSPTEDDEDDDEPDDED